jgi:hypothetical protein
MFRLFQRIPKGLEPVAEIFRDHVEREGTKLVKEVTECKKEKDTGMCWGNPSFLYILWCSSIHFTLYSMCMDCT